MNTGRFILSIIVVLIAALAPRLAFASDTLTPYHHFIEVSSGYLKTPMHLKLKIQKKADFPMYSIDSSISEAEFVLSDSATYINYDSFEQLVNDSIMLLISHLDKRILINQNNGGVTERLKAMASLRMKETSAQELAKKFVLKEMEGVNGKYTIGKINLLSRVLLAGTLLAREEILMQYDAVTLQPLTVQQTNRSLVPIDQETYKNLFTQSQYTDKLIIKDGSCFLVNNSVTNYEFMKVQDNPIRPVVTIGDCIKKSEDGNYQVVQAYSDFTLVDNRSKN